MKDKKYIIASITIGSLWGIAEATIGYVAHVVSLFTFLGFAGMLMSTIGAYFMKMAVKTTKKANYILYVSFVAASIKLFDLLLPFLPLSKTLNPAMAILAEGLCVFLAWKFFFSKGKIFLGSAAVGFGWRIIHALIVGIPTNLISVPYILTFVLLQGAINSLLLYPIFKTQKIQILETKLVRKPVYAITFLLMAISLEIISHII